jgi:ParB-like chromosome segregation protein Spo0J
MKIRFSKYDKLIALKDLKPHPKNRNSHPEEQIARLAEIIKYQGVRSPITVSKQSGFITRGHGRLAAAKLLKMKTFPVVFQNYDSTDQEYADLQADNAIALWSVLDVDAIRKEIADLEFDFDPNVLGLREFAEIEFKEPDAKKDPELKEPDLSACPNCGVAIERG